MKEFLMYSVFTSVFIFVSTWVGAHFLGTDLWKKCSKCGSRQTRTTKHFILTTAETNNGFTFIQDTECDCCHNRLQIALPCHEWPPIPNI